MKLCDMYRRSDLEHQTIGEENPYEYGSFTGSDDNAQLTGFYLCQAGWVGSIQSYALNRRYFYAPTLDALLTKAVDFVPGAVVWLLKRMVPLENAKEIILALSKHNRAPIQTIPHNDGLLVADPTMVPCLQHYGWQLLPETTSIFAPPVS